MEAEGAAAMGSETAGAAAARHRPPTPPRLRRHAACATQTKRYWSTEKQSEDSLLCSESV